MSALRITLAVALLSAAGGAAELAVLQSGFSIRHERREVQGSTTRLYMDSDSDSSYVDVPTADIVSIAPDDAPPPATIAKQPGRSMKESVSAASTRTGVDADLIESVIRAESGFDPSARSRKGAQGLMQLMPETAASLGVQNAYDAEANIDGGTRYLHDLLLQYNSDLAKALAAYNAGPERVQQYHGVPPYHETYAYVARVIKDFNRRKLAQQAARAHDSRKVRDSSSRANGNLSDSEAAASPR